MLKGSDSLPRYDPELGWNGRVGLRSYSHLHGQDADRAGIQEFLTDAGVDVLSGDLGTVQMKAVRFSTFLIAQLRAPALTLRWMRDERRAQDRCLFLFVNRGSVRFEGAVESVISGSGGLGVALPGSDSVTVGAEQPSEVILFTFDRQEVAPIRLDAASIGDVASDSPVFRASYGFLMSMLSSTTSPRPKDAVILRSLTRDVARALATQVSRGTPSSPLDTFHLAQQFIAEHAADPELTPDTLAESLGLSRRTLERAFREHGLRVSAEIRRVRSQRAMELLTGAKVLTVDQLVAAAGFGSRSSLVRAFQENYGVSPSAAFRGLVG
ncbi:MAG: helix-turn-helix domain-containing protein [Microbacterium sp.]